MASLTEPLAGSTPEKRVTFQRATPAQQRLGLGLLLVGKPRPDDSAVDHFLAFIIQQKMSIDELWLAFRDAVPVAAVLLVPSPGRTAVVFVSPTISTTSNSVESRLIGHACAAQDKSKISMVQAILDPGQELESRALTQAGLKHLAQLIYMQRETDGGTPTLALEPRVQATRWTPAARPIFEAGIKASYEKTLDCPALLGLRSMEDIMAGHMASGTFVPDLWLALHRGEEPVGVMLLSLVPQRRSAELVYLGLAPAWRGHGLGRRLVNYGLHLASRYQAATMNLAVDDKNTPAMKLYESIGFHAHACKIAMIMQLA